MFKRNLLLAAFALSTLAALGQTNAQSFNQMQENDGLVFKPHWYMQVQAGVAQTVGEADFTDLLSPAAALSAGYRFTPLWGLRAGVSGWQGKGAWVVPFKDYKYNFLQGNVDATLDLSNLFCHYNPKRFFNAYVFVGVGVNGAFNNDEAVELNDAGYHVDNLWRGKKVFVAGRGGIGADFRLSKHVAFNLEVNANVLSDKFNSKRADNADWHFNALAGFTFKFGKSGKKKAAMVPAPSPAPVQEPVVVKEPVQYVVEVEEKVVEKKEEVQPLNENVFFNINSAVIRSSEESKITDLVSFLQNNPEMKVTIIGYADAATGTNAINLRLSKERAFAVEKALKAKGIAADRIMVDFKGDKVQPFSTPQENRVAICVTE